MMLSVCLLMSEAASTCSRATESVHASLQADTERHTVLLTLYMLAQKDTQYY